MFANDVQCILFYIITYNKSYKEKESICCKTNFLFSFNISVGSYVKTNTVIWNFSQYFVILNLHC